MGNVVTDVEEPVVVVEPTTTDGEPGEASSTVEDVAVVDSVDETSAVDSAEEVEFIVEPVVPVFVDLISSDDTDVGEEAEATEVVTDAVDTSAKVVESDVTEAAQCSLPGDESADVSEAKVDVVIPSETVETQVAPESVVEDEGEHDGADVEATPLSPEVVEKEVA